MTALLSDPSGCGKSTFLHLPGRLDRTDLDETRLTAGTTASLASLASLGSLGRLAVLGTEG
jgi:ABC-type lipoprotein export system ATPase subunit